MSELPWFKFVIAHWMLDRNLAKCSSATRGVWLELIIAMHQDDRSGELRETVDHLAQLARTSAAIMTQALTELQTTKTADVTTRNGIFHIINRKMKREALARRNGADRQAAFREKGGGDPDRWTYIRAKVLLRDDKRCAYCGKKATTVDHVFPRSRGGGHEETNLVACCKNCNCTKNDRTPEEAGMKFHPSFNQLVLREEFGSNAEVTSTVTVQSKEVRGKSKDRESNTPADLTKSNLFRQPNIPTIELVTSVFKGQGGTEEMAKKFFDSNESTGWFLRGSPITNFINLVPGFVSNWNKNEKTGSGQKSVGGSVADAIAAARSKNNS